VPTATAASSYSAAQTTSAEAPKVSAACRNDSSRLVLYEYAIRVAGHCRRHACRNDRRLSSNRSTSASHSGEPYFATSSPGLIGGLGSARPRPQREPCLCASAAPGRDLASVPRPLPELHLRTPRGNAPSPTGPAWRG